MWCALVVRDWWVCRRYRHFEPNGTHWNQVGSKYSFTVTSGYLGYAVTLSSDGLAVMSGDPLFNGMAGDAALYVRASTTLVGGVSQQQFVLRIRHTVTANGGEALGMASAFSADGTQVALGGQYNGIDARETATTGTQRQQRPLTETRDSHAGGSSQRASWLIVFHMLFPVFPVILSFLR